MKQTLKEKVVGHIHKEHLVPYSRVHFILKNILFWSGAVLFLIGGSLAISVLIFRFSNMGIILSSLPRFEGITIITTVLPLTWIILLAIFLYVSYKEIRHTKKGYKVNVGMLGLLIICISSIGGAVLYLHGEGYALDTLSHPFVPFHRSIQSLHEDQSLKPLLGHLVGIVTDINATSLTVEDPFGDLWKVFLSKETTVEKITLGNRVRIEGTRGEDATFYAKTIIPWEIQGKGRFERKMLFPRSNR